MHKKDIQFWQHSHIFGQDRIQAGERNTIVVTVLTAGMMVIEIAAGLAFGSMALLADGLHMASHTVALGINVFAYMYARKHAQDKKFSFGTGKVNSLGGFTGAVLLALFAAFMAWESVKRFMHPVGIAFNEAILVAIAGLIVNGVSVFILDVKDEEHHHENANHHHHHHHHDHNLRSAYLHVLADAITSFLAIFALLTAKYFRLIWTDPMMGIVGGVLVFRWSIGLMRETSDVLLDKEVPGDISGKIKESIECDGDCRITDLHIWSVGPNIYSAIISLVAQNPLAPEQYKKRISPDLGLMHITIEVYKAL